MDWLLAHQDDPDIDDPVDEPKGHSLKSGEGEEDASSAATDATPMSLYCVECGVIHLRSSHFQLQ